MDKQTMMHKLISLTAEVRHLRSKVGVGRRGSAIVRRAHVDALAIVQAHYLGQGCGRVEMGRQGMSKRRWAWAVALLRYAGVVSTRTGDWRMGLTWVATQDRAIALLRDAHGVTLAQLRLTRRQV